MFTLAPERVPRAIAGNFTICVNAHDILAYMLGNYFWLYHYRTNPINVIPRGTCRHLYPAWHNNCFVANACNGRGHRGLNGNHDVS